MNPFLFFVGLTVFVSWLVSDDDKKPAPAAPPSTDGGNFEPPPNQSEAVAEEIPVPQAVTLEVLREIFQDGAQPLRRRDAVEILKGAPYYIPKTNAYRALVPSRRFAPWLREDEDGWLHFVP